MRESYVKSRESDSQRFGEDWPHGLGAFTRHPAGRLGRPFYGWFTDADILFQAASAALFGEGRLKRPKDSIVAPLNQPKTAGLTALRACLVNEAPH